MGRKSCVVDSCDSNNWDNKPGSVTFHRIPQDNTERSGWIAYLAKVNGGSQCPKDGYICSAHFKPCCLSSSGLVKTKILPGHYPTMTSETCARSSELETLRRELTQTKEELRKLKEVHAKAIEEIRVLKQFKKRQELKRTIEVKSDYDTSKKSKKHSSSNEEMEYQNVLTELMSPKKRPRYSDALREFSFHLHYHSPRAYWFLRDYFGKSLPHPRTFSKWTKYIITEPGFIPVSLQYIQQRSLNHSHLMYYALIFDEVSIRKQIIWDGNKMKGYVNYGGIVAQIPSDTEAKSALFILATEINGHKKVPIGYVLTNGLSADLLSEITKQSLIKMSDMNAKVLAITFDGLNSNFSAMERLGAKLNISAEIHPFIRHPSNGSKVFIFPDPCHMFKLLRNTLSKFGTLYNKSNEPISWNYLDQLLQLQTETGLRAANKLTRRHINFEAQKMKVKLCTQVFSSSVSVALRVCRKLEIPEFIGSEATSEFLALMDRLFDSLNSKPSGRGYKAPLRKTNRIFWQPLFKKSIEYLMSLKYKTKYGNYAFLHNSKFGTCVRGVVIAINSLEAIMSEVVFENDSDLQYLPVYKLSQDLLELFFSVLRSRFGFNNNPNAMQLEHGLKAILCCKLSPGLRGNATAQDETTSRISALGNFRALRDPEETFEEILEDQLPDLPSCEALSPFTCNVVAYIAGFVGKAVCSKQKCSSCLLALITTDADAIKRRPDCVLLSEKDNGGLFIPNEDLIEICKISELEIRRSVPSGISSLNRATLTHRILRLCNKSTIFTALRSENTEEHGVFSGHVLQLIRSIVDYFMKIRLHHLSKEETFKINPTTNRNSCTKLVHFKGN